MSRYAKFLGLYHAEGRMIPAPELSMVDVVNGLWVLPAKTTTSSESILFLEIYITYMLYLIFF